MRDRGGLAFALGGGGGRGALQAGALRALLEAGLSPDLLVGTSAGAVNATFLAVRGFTEEALDELEANWFAAAEAELLPANYLWLTVRLMFHRTGIHVGHRMREFFIALGLTPELRFRDLRGPRLIQVAADLQAPGVVLYGIDPDQSVLEGLLASTALPPWVHPMDIEGRTLIDGGVLSNLPIEPALRMGARRIIALDISEPRPTGLESYGFGPFLRTLAYAVECRQIELEIALAAARGVPVHRLVLQGERPVSTWDFSQTEALIKRGYAQAVAQLEAWPELRPTRWRHWIARLQSRLLGVGG